jgi:bleomycin hydrolase
MLTIILSCFTTAGLAMADNEKKPIVVKVELKTDGGKPTIKAVVKEAVEEATSKKDQKKKRPAKSLRPIDMNYLQRLSNATKMEGATRAIHNVLAIKDAKEIALNHEILKKHNQFFNHKVDAKGITNQQKSGRCWLFAALNVLRPAVMEKYHLDNFEFSVNYLSFYDKFEKANLFLEDMLEMSDLDPSSREVQTTLKYAFADGGFWTNAVALIDKYGVMPKDAMPETYTSQNTDTMTANLVRLLKADAIKLIKMKKAGKPIAKIRQAKRRMLAEVYRIMVLHYGQPPKEFVFRYKDKNGKEHKTKPITPKAFYKEYVGVDLNNYVDLMHDPTQPLDKLYRIRGTRGMIEGENLTYANVPIETIKDLTLKVLLENEPVCFACDVIQQMDKDSGIMALNIFDFDSLYGTKIEKMSKADRLRYGEAMVSHAMAFIGVDLANGKPVKWKVENSWGTDRGEKGYFTIYDSWFDEHVYTIVIDKRFLPEKIKKIFNQKPKELPQWYPLNAAQYK